MDAEALFLESRRQREENRTERHLRSQKIHEKRQCAVDLLKARVREWIYELEQISGSATNLSEEEKRSLRMRFVKHEDKLKLLRKECLSTDSLASLLQILNHSSASSESWDDEDDNLTVSDFGIIHAHFSECQSRLDRCRKEKLPRGKFLFKRYRQALENNGQPLEHSELPTSNTRKALVQSKTKRLDPQRTLSDIQHVSGIVVHSDGSMEGIDRQGLAANPSSLVLHNITSCTVELRGFYQTIHLMSVHDSSILIANSIDGAIHVTDCHNMTLHSTCQQLRLHGSVGLNCHVLFKGGAILEDCTRITFWKRRDVSVGDIRDFNWLKNGIPSPNFVVEEESQPTTDLERTEANIEIKDEQSHHDATAAPQDNRISSFSENDIKSVADNQDDEDEL